jgi:hypothetical protein
LYAFGAFYTIITALISKRYLNFHVYQLTPQLTPFFGASKTELVGVSKVELTGI